LTRAREAPGRHPFDGDKKISKADFGFKRDLKKFGIAGAIIIPAT